MLSLPRRPPLTIHLILGRRRLRIEAVDSDCAGDPTAIGKVSSMEDNMATGTVLTEASRQWYSRPDDQRYLSMEDLGNAVKSRRQESWTIPTEPQRLQIETSQIKGEAEARLQVRTYDPTIGAERELEPTHWGFGNLATYAQAPAGYLRTLPAELAAINLQWGLDHNPAKDNVLVLGQSNGAENLRALTSQSYGRIWDQQVVEAVEKVNHDGRWKIPAASYASTNPKRATTLYASDRDVFIFLVDPDHAIEVGNDTLFRGFYAWNSEVGSQVFGLATFLYRYVCDNRMIWGPPMSRSFGSGIAGERRSGSPMRGNATCNATRKKAPYRW